MKPAEDPRIKISIDQMAWAFEQLDCGVPLKSLAVDLGVSQPVLAHRISMAERYGFDAFVHPSARKIA